MRIHNEDYFKQNDSSPWKKGNLTAWDIQGLSDAVQHLKIAIAVNDQSKIETTTTYIKHFARKIS
jgi:hypothetical protein